MLLDYLFIILVILIKRIKYTKRQQQASVSCALYGLISLDIDLSKSKGSIRGCTLTT